MPSLNDIQALVAASRTSGQQSTLGTGQQPGGTSAAQSVTDRFGGTFSSTFSSTMATVFERGVAGEFDDRTLALEEQAALQRLRLAQQEAGVKPVGTSGVPGLGVGGEAGPVTGGGPGGSDAAPDATATGASAGPDPSTVAVAEQRELYAVRVRQSEARLANISVSLKEDFPLAEQLVSASTGTWDPATFVPQTREQAAAFAQRLVIDATEAAARLEIVKTQLDAARFELAQGGGADVQQLVADLEAAYERQKSYVDKLATIVDRQSGGMMTDAGVDAMSGNTMRNADDLPVEEIVDAMRSEGRSEEEIKRVVGAMEAAVEQDKVPEGSPRLKAMASEMTRTLLAQFNQRVQEMQEETRKQAEQRAEQRRIDDKRAERKRVERRQQEEAIDESRSEQAMAEQAQAQRAAQQDADFQRWLQQLAAQEAAKAG